ncbi:type II toxin-antitoxin system PemK/MazF family toxin [Tumebacillus avium]|nr:type II toxin-antitoxin system PemK/MazF family toxin [Tumebacillus avium]
MTVDKNVVISLLNIPNAKISVMNTNRNAETELLHLLQDNYKLMSTQTLHQSVEFILDLHSWHEYGIHGMKRAQRKTPAAKLSYKKGDVVFVKLGTLNTGDELSYDHMGIVIGEFEKFIVIVPITTNRGQNYYGEMGKAVIHVDKGGPLCIGLQNDSTLLVHQIRSVHKNRIIRDLRFSIKGKPLWKELEEKLASRFTTELVDEHNRSLKNMKNKAKSEMRLQRKKLEAHIQLLQEELRLAKARILELETELSVKQVAAGNE